MFNYLYYTVRVICKEHLADLDLDPYNIFSSSYQLQLKRIKVVSGSAMLIKLRLILRFVGCMVQYGHDI